LALFGSGLSFGLVFGTYLAGAFEAEVGWRGTFAIIGGVGVVWAAVTWLAWPHLIPPPAAPTRPRAPQPGAIETLRLLLKTPAFGTIIVGAVLHAFSVNAISQWLPSFLHDTYDMPIKEVGRWVGLTFNTASIVGALAIGFIIDLFAPETKMRQCMRWSWVSLTLTVPLYIGGLLGGGDYSIWLFVPAYLAGALYQAPMYYVVQRMVPDEIRAAANAVVLTTFMISGLGLAPALVGLGSDILESWGVVPHLAVAMTAGASVNFASAYFFFRAEKKLAASTIS
jgi:predicted MFS family arabinose efflux permease